MNKIFLVILFMAVTLISCNNDGDQGIKLSSLSCELNNENSCAEIKIIKGAGLYYAESSDPAVAEASVVDDATINIIGLSMGNAIINIIDMDGNSAAINVSVSEPINYQYYSGEILYMKKGETRTFDFFFDYPDYYTLSIDNEDIASAVVETKKNEEGKTLFTVTAKEMGVASISVKKGMVTLCQYKMNVVDKYDLEVRDDNLKIELAFPFGITGVHIYKGNGTYTAEMDDSAIATVKLIEKEDNTIFNTECNPASVWVNPHKIGKTIMTITDIDTGQIALVDIEIY